MPDYPYAAPPDVDLDKVWTAVAATVWARPIGRIEHLAGRLLGSPGLARALVTTPSLVLSWVLASAAVLTVGVVVTHSSGTPWAALLAPALSGAGIAYAYGPGIDPAFELSQTMPLSDRMILLVRSLAVFGINALLGCLAALGSADVVGLTLGWLLPMAMVSAVALAAATLARSPNVGVAAALTGWGLVVLASALPTQNLAAAVTVGTLPPLYALAAVIGLGLAVYATDGRRGATVLWR